MVPHNKPSPRPISILLDNVTGDDLQDSAVLLKEILPYAGWHIVKTYDFHTVENAPGIETNHG
jgi:hypothetical protein